MLQLLGRSAFVAERSPVCSCSGTFMSQGWSNRESEPGENKRTARDNSRA